jgi:hypothetical protein
VGVALGFYKDQGSISTFVFAITKYLRLGNL